MKTNTESMTKNQAIIALAAEHVRDLLADKIEALTQAALDASSEQGDEESICKVSFALQWSPTEEVPVLRTKIAWSVRHTDETEDHVDPAQMKLAVFGRDELAAAVAK